MAELTDEPVTLRKMDPKAKRAWIRALRSRKYRRAQGQLKKNGGYCCLGVLCEVMKWPYEADEGEPESQYHSSVGLTDLSMGVLVRLNDGSMDGASDYALRAAGKVKGYRDGKGASFNVIADFIERKL